MPAFTPYPDRSLIRALQVTDEQLASVFNQSYQGIIDNLQLVADTVSQITQQVDAISSSVNSLISSYNSQLSSLQTLQDAATPILATSTQHGSTASTLNNRVNTAVSKTTSSNTALTAAETNLTSVSTNALPYNAFLTAIGALSRPANSIFQMNSGGAVGWQASVGQSFTMEMASITLDRTVGTLGGNSAAGSFNTVPINTTGYMNARNSFGLVEISFNSSGNTITVPCTGGNCVYYAFTLATFCGIGGAASRIMLDSTVVASGSTVQSIAGQSAEANDFNQTSSAFGRFTVGSSSPLLRLEGIVQANHPSALGAALGRPVGGNSNFERYATVLLLRRRML